MTPRVVLIDSGVDPEHPHLRGCAVELGPVFTDSGPVENPSRHRDDLGHGTCAAAALFDLAPEIELVSLKVFDATPTAPVERLLAALDHALALEPAPGWVLMPLGLRDRDSIASFEARLARARALEVTVVAPLVIDGLPSYPGSLSGALPVAVDASLPRERPEPRDGIWYASPHPRDLPGLPRERNLQGGSFAVSNLAGFLIARGG